MRLIQEYLLYEGPIESYHELHIPQVTKLKLSRHSSVLSVLTHKIETIFRIKAYVEELIDGESAIKMIALVTTNLPENDDVGWKFLNSLVIPDSRPIQVYHAYVKIC